MAHKVTISIQQDKKTFIVVEAESNTNAQAAMKDALEAINIVKKKV